MPKAVAWSDLNAAQRALLLQLAKAEYGLALEDVVGVELDDIPEALHSAVGMCIDDRLVTIDVGWLGSVWVRLTAVGRRLEEGFRQ